MCAVCTGDMLNGLLACGRLSRVGVLTFASWRFSPSLQDINTCGPHVMISNLSIRPFISHLHTHTSVYKPQLGSLSTRCVCRTCSLSMSDTMPCSRVSSVWCCGSWSRRLFLRLLSASLSSCTSSACCQNKNRTRSQRLTTKPVT